MKKIKRFLNKKSEKSKIIWMTSFLFIFSTILIFIFTLESLNTFFEITIGLIWIIVCAWWVNQFSDSKIDEKEEEK